MIPKIAIQGHPTRGKEVIQILESLGGKNTVSLKGTEDVYYYIDNSDKTIYCHYYNYINKYCKKYTLEEFEKEFPFKVGDIVITNNSSIGIIEELDPNYISPYCIKMNGFRYWCETSSLRLYKEMKEERNITLTLDKAREWYNKGGELKEVALQAFNEEELIKTKLPKTFEEFCDMYPVKGTEVMIACDCTIVDCTKIEGKREYEFKDIMPSKKSAEAHLVLMQLEQLRDCYRQGDIPDFTNNDCKYCINKVKNDIRITISYNTSCFLSFTKEKVAEEYLTNFKPLIKIAEDYI